MNQPRATLAAGMEVTPTVRLVSPIGEGGMGAVWLADHTALATRVVVKFMLGGLDSSTSARARFKREAEAASQVKSPHVVTTFDYGVTAEGVPFIVMEHLEGRDLARELAAEGALPPARVVAIVSQVARALSKAHAAGLLHRDIKPDNIFLCKQDADDELFVKLLDFGIAKTSAAGGEEITLDGQTKTGQVVGTPFYMSPEQVTAQKVIDSRSDLWSLGVVAFEALTAQRPFDGPSFGALAVKIATGEPPRPSRVNAALPAAIDEWFLKACARDPQNRFATARELSDGFRHAFAGIVSLPPVPSGLTDSGPREGSATARSPQTPQPSLQPGPISVDHDAHDRPSFVLASTLEGVEGEGEKADRSSLARSEPGGASVAIEGAAAPYPARRPLPMIIGAFAGTVLVAGAIGIGIGKWDPIPAKNPGRNVSSSAPLATSVALPVSAAPVVTVATTPVVPSSSPSSTADDGGAPLVIHAPSARPASPVTPPVAPASSKTTPTASAAASTHPNAPDAGRHGDILF